MTTPSAGSPERGASSSAASRHLPLGVAIALLILGGIFLLNRADAQARDTIRKHHLQDLEDALFFARDIHGTYPPYDQPTWCGPLDSPDSEPARQLIEEVLRQQNNQYANPAKPFPTDPLADQSPSEARQAKLGHPTTYFYWKHSPASFELLANLERPDDPPRTIIDCSTSSPTTYNYSLTSVWREHR